MISFACSHCGQKLTVKDDLAGKQTNCSACKQPLVVPPPSVTIPPFSSPSGGQRSSLARTGIETNLTLSGIEPTVTPAAPTVDASLARGKASGERYVVEGEVARGGMGAIVRAIDCDIRREVALKYLLDHSDLEMKVRFVEEAQITGQLEHPNIVPIHEVGVDAQTRLFFSMKMVKGRSLAQVIDDLKTNPKTAAKDYPLGRLLTIFVSVCNALAYAHARGVVHRDVKPANIMIGDFGEVYLMDWGLAKVLTSGGPGEAKLATPAQRLATAFKVKTNRSGSGDLTEAGSIMGSLAYMPPEQATGQLDQIDQRSDVFALGAILYELLTLRPPLDTDGSTQVGLQLAADCRIVPPEQRQPERARAGQIPKELSAIAMKALAKNKQDRYATAEDLRRDIELFQQGRAVSAKEDTFKEMAWKLVKRNKGASATAAAALVVLTVLSGFFLKINYDARMRAEKAYQAYQQQVKDSVPVLLRAAKAALNERQFDDALGQASLAVKSAPDDADARLLKGELLITRQRFGEAASELEEYEKLRGQDAAVQTLTKLCRKAQSEDVAALLAFAEVFTQRQDHALADGVLSGHGKTTLEARQRLLEMYCKRIEAAWPGQGKNLTMNVEGRLSLGGLGKISDLTPLRGMPLTKLDLSGNDQVRDLTPLIGMPLTSLNLANCSQIRDLAPLKRMPLTTVILIGCSHVQDLEPLRRLPLTSLNLIGTKVHELAPLQGMPLTWLSLYNCPVRDLAPLQGLPLTSLSLAGTQVQDLGPLQGLPLTSLSLYLCRNVRDLAPLQGLPLTSLVIDGTQVANLAPLQGMPLSSLVLNGLRQVTDLEPLKGMPLKVLNIEATGVTDLTPLQASPLEKITLTPKNITQGLELLRGLKSLKTICVEMGAWPPTDFWKKYDAGEFR